MAYGVDFAFYPHASIGDLQRAGVRFVCRYTSPETANDVNGKNLLPGECRAYLDAGIAVVVVHESYAQRMLYGRAAGSADALHADTVVKALGMPGIPIYFACDFDAAEVQQPSINGYLDGAAGIIGRARVGLYGGYWPLMRARKAGKATYYWGTVAWSGNNWATCGWLPHIMQGLSTKLGGASVDPDWSHAKDFGQWPRPAPVTAPAGVLEGESMYLSFNGDGKASVVVAPGAKVMRVGCFRAATLRIDYIGPNSPPSEDGVQLGYDHGAHDSPCGGAELVEFTLIDGGLEPIDVKFG